MKLQVIAIGLLSLCGCALFASTDKYEAKLNTWIGHPVTDLEDSWGYAAGSFIAADGNKVYVYSSSSSVTQPMTVYQSTYGGQTATTVTGGDTTQYSCVTYFETDATGRIIKWRYTGNACRST